MASAIFNLFLEGRQDTPIHVVWEDGTGTPVNLTGYTAKIQFRLAVDSTVVLTKTNADFTLGGAAGTIDFTITSAQTVTLGAAGPRGLVWDILLTSAGGSVTKLWKGRVDVDPSVTQP